jgi:D-aminopeptidase
VSRPRASDLGLAIGTLPSGPLDAITDVDGIRVGSVTLIEGDAVRTGVTVVVPHDGREPLFAGAHRLNGNGELTGLEWIREAGCLTTPIGLTNTHSVGVVRDAIVAIDVAGRDPGEVYWSLPVVGETWDGVLNDINGFHVHASHVHEAFAKASAGPVEEGGVGSGTGMICHGFKGGLGTASRIAGDWTVGVLVQANHGRRDRLTVAGRPVGTLLGPDVVPLPWAEGAGSIIVLCATDAPLLPHQCERLAQRCALGLGRTFEAFARDLPRTIPVTMVVDPYLDALFHAAVEATEAAIVNALLAGETMTGRNGATAHGLGAERLMDALARL